MVGGYNAWLVYSSYIFDACIYPRIASQYLVNAIYPDESDAYRERFQDLVCEAIVSLHFSC
jgi:hypothetical protein|eukprot:COSAG01_NODE_473_length_16542_cov_42.403651_20_plen_61_part_00